MKKIIFMSIICILNSSVAFATESFFYKRGYEQGFNTGFDEGVTAGLKAAREALQKYKNDIDSYEVGKYLIASRKLTYPSVWQEIDNNTGSVTLRVLPSRIEGILDIDDLLSRYTNIPKRPRIDNSVLELSLEEKNSAYLSERDSNSNDLPENVSERLNQIRKLSIDKTSENLEILKQANIIYSEEDENYIIVFFSEEEQKTFCNNFPICTREEL